MKRLIFIIVCILGLSSFAWNEESYKNYRLPDNVPAEVQDFARFYEDFYHEALKVDKIKIRDVEYCAVKGGYALVFDVKFQDGKIRFACLRDGTFAIRKGTEVFNMEFDGHSGYSYFMPSASKLVYEITDNAFIVSLSGEGCLVLGN